MIGAIDDQFDSGLRCAGLLFKLDAHGADLWHPAQQGSWSIKKVLPTLGDGSPSYADLQDVADGQDAVQAYLRATSPGVDPAEVASLKEALLRYCEQDTVAMVKLWEHLTLLAEMSDPASGLVSGRGGAPPGV